MAENTVLGVAVAFDAMQPPKKRLGRRTLQTRLRDGRPPEQIRLLLAPALLGAFSYTYQNVSDTDLLAYLEFSRSRPACGITTRCSAPSPRP